MARSSATLLVPHPLTSTPGPFRKVLSKKDKRKLRKEEEKCRKQAEKAGGGWCQLLSPRAYSGEPSSSSGLSSSESNSPDQEQPTNQEGTPTVPTTPAAFPEPDTVQTPYRADVLMPSEDIASAQAEVTSPFEALTSSSSSSHNPPANQTQSQTNVADGTPSTRTRSHENPTGTEGFLLSQVQSTCRDLVACVIRRVNKIFYRAMDQATSSDEVLPLVQIDHSTPTWTIEAFPNETEPSRPVCRVSKHAMSCSKHGALVDRGANGGIIGNDANIILCPPTTRS